MMTCCKYCCPHCDFYIHSKYHYLELNEERVRVVEGCKLYSDETHQSLARSLCYCKDFHCYKVDTNKEEH